jgi:hypothetical protein
MYNHTLKSWYHPDVQKIRNFMIRLKKAAKLHYFGLPLSFTCMNVLSHCIKVYSKTKTSNQSPVSMHYFHSVNAHNILDMNMSGYHLWWKVNYFKDVHTSLVQ